MKYMQKKGEEYPLPFDEQIYDATVYEVFEILDAESDKKPKEKKPKGKPEAEPAQMDDSALVDDVSSFSLDDLD